MATPTKNICCRLCNDTGIKPGGEPFEVFHQLLNIGKLPAVAYDRFCNCSVGAYKLHESKSSAVPT